MKKHYSEPEMEVVGLSREDMILTSAGCAIEDEEGVVCCDAATTGDESCPCEEK